MTGWLLYKIIDSQDALIARIVPGARTMHSSWVAGKKDYFSREKYEDQWIES